MDRFKLLAIPILLLICLKTNTVFSMYVVDVIDSNSSNLLDIQVNYAVDAAADKVADDTPNLNMDYVDEDKVQVDPQTALDMFSTVMCKSMGWADTSSNRSAVRNEVVKSFVVCGYDGMYMGEPTRIDVDGTYDIVFRPKIPYTCKRELSTGTTRYYALNLGKVKTNFLQVSTDGALSYGHVTDITKTEEGAVSNSTQQQVISSVISDNLMKSIFRNVEGKTSSTVYIPSEATLLSKTNTIEGVTVMAYVDNPYSIKNLSDGRDSILGIGGTRLKRQAFVGGYTRDDNKKYYCFLNALPSDITIDKIEVTYVDARSAALHGYQFDMKSLK